MKFLLSLFVFLITCSLAQAEDWTLEVRGAYYRPSSKDTRSVYSEAWLDYQVLTTKRISQYVQCWAEVDWSIKKGHTSRGVFGYKDRTRAWVLPLSIGLRGIYCINPCLQVYLGAGVTYSFLNVDHRCEDFYSASFYSSSPFKKHIRKTSFGGLFKLGVLIDTGDNTFIDVFADYILQSFHLGKHDLFEEKMIGSHFKASGLKVGVGFGVNF